MLGRTLALAVLLSFPFLAPRERVRPSQDDAAAQRAMKKQFLAMSERVGPPTEEQHQLDVFVGTFELHTNVDMGSGRVMRVHGTAVGEAILDGRFVEVDAAAAPDEELKGERKNVFGWDPTSKEFTLWGIESRNNLAYTARGTFDASEKTFTFEGELPQADGSAMPFLWVFQISPDGSIDQEIDVQLPGASDYAHMVDVHYARSK